MPKLMDFPKHFVLNSTHKLYTNPHCYPQITFHSIPPHVKHGLYSLIVNSR